MLHGSYETGGGSELHGNETGSGPVLCVNEIRGGPVLHRNEKGVGPELCGKCCSSAGESVVSREL